MAKAKYELEFAAVLGAGPFAFDMLRYDHCVPAREQDSHEMGRDHYRSDRVVILKRYRGQPGAWTPARWKSMGWTLILDRAGRPWDSLGDLERWTEKNVKILTNVLPGVH